MVALRSVTAEVLKRRPYLLVFHAFRYDVELKVLREIDEGADYLCVNRNRQHVTDIPQVDLELVQRQLGQVIYGRIARPEIVDREARFAAA